jgi:hypothetical protein
MRVRNFLLADAVAVGPEGKAFIHGAGIDRVHAMTFPWTQPQLAAYITLLREEEQFGSDHYFRFRFLRPDGSRLGPEIGGNFRIPTPQDPDSPVQMNLALALAGIEFPEAGRYEAELEVDEEVLDSLPLVVALREAPSTAAAD